MHYVLHALDHALCTSCCLSGEQHSNGDCLNEFIHCKIKHSAKPEKGAVLRVGIGKKQEKKRDLSKDDFFMAVGKLAAIQSNSETKVQSLNLKKALH